MKKISLFLLLTGIIATSCKNDEVNKESEVQKPFTIEMKAKFAENDVICIYYKDSTIGFFSEDMAIYKNIISGDSTQTLVFELPEGTVPNDFRLDLSHENPNQKMIISQIIFTNRENSFTINKKDIDKYFTPNQGVIFNNDDKSFAFKKTEDGNYDPFLTTTGQFYPLLEALVGSKAFVQ